MTGSLALDLVDFSWLGEAVYGPLFNAEDGSLAAKDFALPMFAGRDVVLDLKAKTVRSVGLPAFEDLAGRLTSRGGGMTLEDISANWMGGRIAGRLSMSNNQGVGLFQTKLKAENVDLAPLGWQSHGQPVAQGRLGFDFVAEATSNSPAGLLEAASGSGTIRLSELSLPRINSGLMTSLLARADGIEGDVTENKVRPIAAALLSDGSTQVGVVDIPFTMTGGEVRAQNITVRTPNVTLAGELRIDLVEEALDGVLGLAYDAGEEALAGGDPSLRLVYSGPLAAPQEQIDVSAMTNYLSLRAFEKERRRVETLQASVLEKQRLRREVALYTFRETERRVAAEKAQAEARARVAEEARQRAEERERQGQQQIQREQIPQLTVPPTDDMFRPDGSLPGVTGN
jgi:AsmA-like C-terminal region